jgi:hypothetical protein
MKYTIDDTQKKQHIKTPDDWFDFYKAGLIRLNCTQKGLIVSLSRVTRTNKQNNALHSTLGEWNTLLNDAGYSYSVVFGNRTIKRTFTVEILKELFKGLSKRKYNIKSTTKLDTQQITDIYRDFNELMSSEYQGIDVSWHNKEISGGLK